ncbi:MAG: hypothetical protein GOP50_13550 [Candidatus Heimdallarchaeota archaeon]|nr:hypothetical protein [Candidatus Heimdallarchaeota archaeon]
MTRKKRKKEKQKQLVQYGDQAGGSIPSSPSSGSYVLSFIVIHSWIRIKLTAKFDY